MPEYESIFSELNTVKATKLGIKVVKRFGNNLVSAIIPDWHPGVQTYAIDNQPQIVNQGFVFKNIIDAEKFIKENNAENLEIWSADYEKYENTIPYCIYLKSFIDEKYWQDTEANEEFSLSFKEDQYNKTSSKLLDHYYKGPRNNFFNNPHTEYLYYTDSLIAHNIVLTHHWNFKYDK